MNLRTVGILLRKEIGGGPRNLFFVFTLVVPVIITLVVQALTGSFFSGKPTLAVVDPGGSRFTELAGAEAAINLRRYDDQASLRDAVADGAADMGLVIPSNFDQQLDSGEPGELTAYVWGESLLRNRTILGTTLAALLREATGRKSLIDVVTTVIGDESNAPLSQRFVPLLVLITIIIGGAAVPAASLVEEKQRRTLRALVVTPTTLNDILLAKGATGVILSVLMTIVVLLLNQAFGGQLPLLLAALVLSAIFSAALGVLLGALIKNIDTLFAVLKATGLLLYAPAFIFLFPDSVPQWIARVFPTYYMVKPVTDISQFGARLGDVALDLGILVLLTVATMVAAGLVARRTEGRLALKM